MESHLYNRNYYYGLFQSNPKENWKYLENKEGEDPTLMYPMTSWLYAGSYGGKSLDLSKFPDLSQ